MIGNHPVFARSRHRRALSLLEFVGCFVAMVGGVLLGSMYLGVDTKALLFSTVTQVQRMTGATAPSEETVPAAASAAVPIVATAQVEQRADLAKQQAATSADRPQAKPDSTPVATPEPAAEAPVTAAAEAPAVVPPTELKDILALTDEQRVALTSAYWTALDTCMRNEFTHRASAVSSSGDLELYRYLTVRHEGHRQAAETIASLNRNGVDAHVTSYGEKARRWHEEGSKLYARAKDLLTDAPTAQLSGPFAQSWQSAATQHQMEERLLAEKHHAVANYLSHKSE